MKRRDALKALCAAGGCALAAKPASASEAAGELVDPVGVLVDTTRCLGCRMCEYACAEQNGLPQPETDVDMTDRRLSPAQRTVVMRAETEQGPVTVKRQCMHCLQPACASACLTRAMIRTPESAVIWRKSKCMGCRFCMVSCPFDVPTFDYDSPLPEIRKCQFCWERLVDGGAPACVSSCPAGALQFGRRADLLDEGRRRIATDPDRYVHHIYGEHEVGGTSWMYLSAVPFDQLGFRTDLGTTSYPTFTREFLYGVPLVLTLVPPLLLAVNRATRREEMADVSHEGEEEER